MSNTQFMSTGPLLSNFSAAVFDLDGVLVNTAGHHLAAWETIAKELGFSLSPEIAEATKGVGRLEALRLVLADGALDVTPEQLQQIAARKNAIYRNSISGINSSTVLEGARECLQDLQMRHVPIALASASRSGRYVLERTDLLQYFNAVVDGTVVSAAKPAPDVFLRACEIIETPPEACVVFEDALAGVQGARAAGCFVVGVGDPSNLGDADTVISSLNEVCIDALFEGGPR